MGRKRFTDKECAFIKENFEKFGPQFCSDELNKTKNSISDKAHSLGLKLPHDTLSKIHCAAKSWTFRKEKNNKSVDKNLFIDNYTKESAYILGLLWSDGCVRFKYNKYQDIILKRPRKNAKQLRI
jgi:hypothetical protein